MNTQTLDDSQLLTYLEDGYVVLHPPELDDDFHDRMYRAACHTYGLARGAHSEGIMPHFGVIADNLRPRIPEVGTLLATPSINGAIESVLGQDWQIYPHDFIHESSDRDQGFHQDGNLPWNDRGHYRCHRPEWAMLFYYPQTTSLESGPTEVIPGTQYWTTDFELPEDKWHRGDPVGHNLTQAKEGASAAEQQAAHLQLAVDSFGSPNLSQTRIELPKGSLVLASYDLAHRGTGQSESFQGRRFMYKFYLYRATEPTTRQTKNRSLRSPSITNHDLARIVERNWAWLNGQRVKPKLNESLRSNLSGKSLIEATNEADRIRVAYELSALANQDSSIALELRDLVASECEGIRRAAAYSFGSIENVDSTWFKDLLNDPRATVRRPAILALREAQCRDAQSIVWLQDLLTNDPDDLVRSNAAYALGLVARSPQTTPFKLDCLLERLDPQIEPDNTMNGGMSRSTVRENAALALTMCQLNADEADRTVRFAISEHDRYAKSLLFIAVQRSARQLASGWASELINYLTEKRFVS